MSDGRRFASALEARGERDDAGRLTLFAPQPGLWRHAPPEGALIRPGAVVGELEVLGVLHVLRAPQDAFGVVGGLPGGRRLGRRPVDARTALMTLDPEGVSGTEAAKVAAQAADGATGPVFRTPLGGRFYARPSPVRAARRRAEGRRDGGADRGDEDLQPRAVRGRAGDREGRRAA